MSRVVTHMPRRSHGMRWDLPHDDLQRDHGASMDAPAWIPRGAARSEKYMAGTSCEFYLDTGYVGRPDIGPARRLVPVKVDGRRFLVEFYRDAVATHPSIAMRVGDVRSLDKPRRLLRTGPLRRQVVHEAIAENVR